MYYIYDILDQIKVNTFKWFSNYINNTIRNKLTSD